MSATVGAPAPEFTLKDQDQKEVRLSEFRGKKLLLSLMLTPVIVPSIITAIAMYYLAGKLGLIGMKLPRFRGVELDLGDYGSVVTASIAAS